MLYYLIADWQVHFVSFDFFLSQCGVGVLLTLIVSDFNIAFYKMLNKFFCIPLTLVKQKMAFVT